MSLPDSDRLARRRRAHKRTTRRQRAGAALALASLAALLGWLASGSGSNHHAGTKGRPSRGASARGPAGIHLVVSPEGQLPAAVQDAAGAPAAEGGALLIGGLDSSEASVADVVQIEGVAARRVATLPTALHDACATPVGGAVYAFGGGEQTSFSQILKVATAGQAEPVGSLPTPASDVACTTIAGVVYVVGGYTGQEPLRTILAWRPGETPAVVGTLPKPLRYAAISQVGGQVVIAGGTSGTQASRDVYRFDPLSGSVRELARLPFPVTHAAGAALGGTMLVIGGRGEDVGSQRHSILAISPTGAVSVAGALPLALSDLAAAQSGRSLILAGGVDRTGRTQREILRVTLKEAR
ncbi:MAG: Kelch repeat-containing protein [Solirubrobacterales bacterium]